MRVKVKDTFQMTLVLNKAETVYLRDICQNYMGFGNGDDEPADQALIRHDLFINCDGALRGDTPEVEDDDDGFTI